MKPFIAALALETGRVTPDTMIQTAPGRITITGSTISDAHPHGVLSVAEVIQKSSNVGTVQAGDADAAARDVGAVRRRSASARSRSSISPAR